MSYIIKIDRLKKTINGSTILDIDNTVIEKNKITAIYGYNGAGKSTLFNILAGIDDKFTGSYKLYCAKIGYVVQFIENIVCKKNIKTEIVSIVNDVELADNILKEINLINRKNESPFNLSDGEKRVLFITSVLAISEAVIIDEPFANLDKKNIEKIEKFFKTSKDLGKTIIYSSNRLKDIIIADVVLELIDGKIKRRNC